MNKISHLLILILVFLLVIYRDVIFGQQIIFPSNYLAGFFSPYALERSENWKHGIPYKPIGLDLIRFFYPQRVFTNEEISAGRLPLWNPYIFSGNPHLANLQSAVFYPLNAIYLFLPTLIAWSLIVLSQFVLSSIFMYKYLKLIGLSGTASCFGSFTFSFSGYLIVWSQENLVVGHTALWTPLLLYSVEKFIQEKKFKFWLLLSITTAITFLAGHLQTFIYIYALIFSYAIWRNIQLIANLRRILANLAILSFAVIVAFLLSAIQFLPSLEIYLLSPRHGTLTAEIFQNFLLQTNHFLRLLAPDIHGNIAVFNYFGKGAYHETTIYVGVIPLVASLSALFLAKRNPLIFFFFITTITSLFLTIENPFVTTVLYANIPLISTFVPSRILVITTVSLAILSAFGMEYLSERKTQKIFSFISFIIMILLVTIGINLYRQTLNNTAQHFLNTKQYFSIKNLILPTLMLFLSGSITLIVKNNKAITISLFLITIVSQGYFFQKYLAIGNKELFYPQNKLLSFLQEKSVNYYRYQSLEIPIYSNFSILAKLYSPEGLDPMFPKRYAELFAAAENQGQVSEQMSRIEVYASTLPKEESLNAHRLKLFSLLGVKYFTFHNRDYSPELIKRKFPENTFKEIAEINNWKIFEYSGTLPRTFLVGNYQVASRSSEILNLLFAKETDLSKTVILEENLPLSITSSNYDSSAEAKIISYAPQSIKIETRCSAPKILFLSDSYYPGWKAFVDGIESKIYRANYAFRAVYIPAGTHTVNFVYSPASVKIGATISLATILILFMTVSTRFYLSKRKSQ